MDQQRQGTKSDLLDCLEQSAPSSKGIMDFDEKVVDEAVIIYMLRPRDCRTIEDYVQNICQPFITSSLGKVKRLDVI